MAWNDPPSFDYQQLSNSGRKFKHRYVNSVETKLGQNQQAPPLFQQPHHNHQSTFTTQPAPIHYQTPQNQTGYPAGNFSQHHPIPQQQANLNLPETNLPVYNLGSTANNYNSYPAYPQQPGFQQQQQPLPSQPQNPFPAQAPRQ